MRNSRLRIPRGVAFRISALARQKNALQTNKILTDRMAAVKSEDEGVEEYIVVSPTGEMMTVSKSRNGSWDTDINPYSISEYFELIFEQINGQSIDSVQAKIEAILSKDLSDVLTSDMAWKTICYEMKEEGIYLNFDCVVLQLM